MKTLGPPPSYYEWFAKQTFTSIDKEMVRKLVSDELTRFASMPTEEYILWQKWEEVRDAYPMEYSSLVDEYAYRNSNDARLITQVKNLLWDGYDYENIVPELIWCNEEGQEDIKDHWTALRIMIHTQQHSGSIGRGINYLVRDKITKKYLGVIAIASDFLDLAGRDTAIGWTRIQRTQEQRIQHTAVCSTIVPVQPFGYNCLGGKLLALLCLSEPVQAKWKELYGSTLVGLTTTSLYGANKGMSQYDNLRYWKNMGYSSGSTALRMSLRTKNLVYTWAKTNLPEEFYKFLVHKEEGPVRDKLNRFNQAIYRRLGISAKLFTSNHDRGIYFARLYENTDAFLRNEIREEELTPIGKFGVEDLTILWKEKYAKRRFDRLNLDGTLKCDPLFYDDLSILTWEEAKAKYLSDVGR